MTVSRPDDTKLTFRAMQSDEGDLELFRACFARNSDRGRSIDQLRWQYTAGVTGKLFVDFALTSEQRRVAAIYATLPGYMRINGQRRLVLQSLDTLTDTDFRGRGLFVTLARETFRRAAEQDTALIYGFPNGSSAHGFFNKLGWTSLDPLPMLLRPLRTGYFAERAPERFRPFATRVPDLPLAFPFAPVLGRLRDLTRADLDERVNDVWNDFAAGVGVALDRDAAYLRWRLFEKPGESYVVRALERRGRLDALIAYTVKGKHGGRIGYVMELLHRRGAPLAGALLLSRAIRDMARDHADAVLAWCLPHSPNFLAHVVNGFFPLPEKMRPIELHAGVRAFDETIDPVVRARESWYLSYLDSDTV